MRQIALFITLSIGISALFIACASENAEELFPKGPCEIEDVISYSLDVAPILETHCYRCHNQSNRTAGLALDQYEDVLPVSTNKAITLSMQAIAPYSMMPTDGPAVDSCDIAKINRWIDAGSPNN